MLVPQKMNVGSILLNAIIESHRILLYSTVQYSTVQYSTVQYSMVQYSTVQYGTVQYSVVQYSTESRLLFYHGNQVCKGSKDQKVKMS